MPVLPTLYGLAYIYREKFRKNIFDLYENIIYDKLKIIDILSINIRKTALGSIIYC